MGRSSDFLGTALRESWNGGCLGRGQNALAPASDIRSADKMLGK